MTSASNEPNAFMLTAEAGHEAALREDDDDVSIDFNDPLIKILSIGDDDQDEASVTAHTEEDFVSESSCSDDHPHHASTVTLLDPSSWVEENGKDDQTLLHQSKIQPCAPDVLEFVSETDEEDEPDPFVESSSSAEEELEPEPFIEPPSEELELIDKVSQMDEEDEPEPFVESASSEELERIDKASETDEEGEPETFIEPASSEEEDLEPIDKITEIDEEGEREPFTEPTSSEEEDLEPPFTEPTSSEEEDLEPVDKVTEIDEEGKREPFTEPASSEEEDLEPIDKLSKTDEESEPESFVEPASSKEEKDNKAVVKNVGNNDDDSENPIHAVTPSFVEQSTEEDLEVIYVPKPMDSEPVTLFPEPLDALAGSEKVLTETALLDQNDREQVEDEESEALKHGTLDDTVISQVTRGVAIQEDGFVDSKEQANTMGDVVGRHDGKPECYSVQNHEAVGLYERTQEDKPAAIESASSVEWNGRSFDTDSPLRREPLKEQDVSVGGMYSASTKEQYSVTGLDPQHFNVAASGSPLDEPLEKSLYGIYPTDEQQKEEQQHLPAQLVDSTHSNETSVAMEAELSMKQQQSLSLDDKSSVVSHNTCVVDNVLEPDLKDTEFHSPSTSQIGVTHTGKQDKFAAPVPPSEKLVVPSFVGATHSSVQAKFSESILPKIKPIALCHGSAKYTNVQEKFTEPVLRNEKPSVPSFVGAKHTATGLDFVSKRIIGSSPKPASIARVEWAKQVPQGNFKWVQVEGIWKKQSNAINTVANDDNSHQIVLKNDSPATLD